MFLAEGEKWEEFCTWVSGFSNERLIEEIEHTEHLIDCDIACNSLFCDEIIALYDFLRDECVRRVKLMAEDKMYGLENQQCGMQ